MKSPKIWIALPMLCALVIASTAHAEKEKGGGHYEELKFGIVIKKVADLIRRNSARFPEIPLLKLNQALKEVKVDFVFDPVEAVDGPHENANNPKTKLIEMNLFKWRSASGKPSLQAAMTLHELLGVMEINDINYYISHRLVALMSSQPVSFFPIQLFRGRQSQCGHTCLSHT